MSMISVELHLKLDFHPTDEHHLDAAWLGAALEDEISRLLKENINDFWDWNEYGVEIDEEDIIVVPADV